MKLLKNLLNVTYYFFNVVYALACIVLILLWFDLIPKLTVLLEQDFNLSYIFKISFIIEMISFILFLNILKAMRDVVTQFNLKKYFTIENSVNKRFIGKLIIITYIIDEWILTYLLPFIDSFENFNIEMNFIEILGIASYKLFIGLFLLGVGKAFELGLKQQQENELTI